MDKPLERTWHPAVDELQSRVKGQVPSPLDGEYDAVRRIWNGMIGRRPAAILRCREAGDVPPALAWCRHHGMDFSLRGGGGNFGIVTRFEFTAHPVGPDVRAGLTVHPFDQARDVLGQYRCIFITTKTRVPSP